MDLTKKREKVRKNPSWFMGTSTLIQDGKADMATLRTEACFIKVGILTVKLNAMKGVLCTTRANVVQLKIRTGF